MELFTCQAPSWRVLVAVVVGAVACVAGPACKPVDEISPLDGAVQGMRIKDYSGGTALIEIDFTVDNPNAFDVRLMRVSGLMTVNDRELGTVTWSGEETIAASAATTASISDRLEVGEHDKTFAAIIDGQPLAYRMSGTLTVTRGVIEKQLDFEARGRLNDAQ